MLSEKLKEQGVVGAGGAGFPTYVKANSKVEFMLANGAECEPLVHKDVELMKNFPAQIVSGMNLMMKATGAQRGKFGIKSKNTAAIAAIEAHLKARPIDMVFLGDFYPSGDEYELVYTATGRLIPPAGIPLQVGCVVNNVETLYNVHGASKGVPVTEKFVSIAGAVREPQSFWAPIGTSFRDLIELAGGATVPEFAMFVSGIMMGSLSFDLDAVVTKTTAGLIVLPRDHYLITRKGRPEPEMSRIGKSACDQCSYCTEFCPRYLLGYEVMPHKVMRSLGFTADRGGQLEPVGAALLFVRAVHTLCVSGRPVPARSVRQRQSRPAHRRHQIHAAEAGGRAPDEGSAAGAAHHAEKTAQGGGIRGRHAVPKHRLHSGPGADHAVAARGQAGAGRGGARRPGGERLSHWLRAGGRSRGQYPRQHRRYCGNGDRFVRRDRKVGISGKEFNWFD